MSLTSLSLSHSARRFNLVEILISLAVLVVSLFIMMGSVPAALKNLERSKSNIYAPMAVHATSTWLNAALNDKVVELDASNCEDVTYSKLESQVNLLATSFGYWGTASDGVCGRWAPESDAGAYPWPRRLPTASAFSTIPATPPAISALDPWNTDPFCEINTANFTKVYESTQGHALYQHNTEQSLLKYIASSAIGGTPVVDFECGLRIWSETEANSTMSALHAHNADNTSFNYWSGPDALDYKSGSNYASPFYHGPRYNSPVFLTAKARTLHILATWPVTEPITRRIARGNYFHITRLVKGQTFPELINFNLYRKGY